MSLMRLVFYSAMIGGWAAFLGWFLCEIIFLHRTGDVGWLGILFTAGLVGGGIAGGLMLLGAVANGTLRGHLHRLWPGLAGGFLAGALGGTIGNAFVVIMPAIAFLQMIALSVGWCIMGLCIGLVEGIWDRSSKKLVNGLIGGSIGGFLGGLLFLPIVRAIGTDMSGRAVSFVILGMSIGLFIGLAQVILKEAWLTVEDGFRPGRQHVLSLNTTILGTSEKAQLPFIAFGAKGVEPIHLRILRQDNGTFVLEDNTSRTGTFLNGQRINGPVVLQNEDLIQLGVNKVRFREVTRHVVAGEGIQARTVPPPAPAVPVPAMAVAAGPPPVLQPASAPPPLPPTAIKPAQPAAPTPRPPAAPPPLPAATKPAAPKPTAPQPPSQRPPVVVPAGAVKSAPTPVQPPPSVPPQPAAPPAAAPPAASQGCPICGRVGAQVPNSSKRRCASCGILYG